MPRARKSGLFAIALLWGIIVYGLLAITSIEFYPLLPLTHPILNMGLHIIPPIATMYGSYQLLSGRYGDEYASDSHYSGVWGWLFIFRTTLWMIVALQGTWIFLFGFFGEESLMVFSILEVALAGAALYGFSHPNIKVHLIQAGLVSVSGTLYFYFIVNAVPNSFDVVMICVHILWAAYWLFSRRVRRTYVNQIELSLVDEN